MIKVKLEIPDDPENPLAQAYLDGHVFDLLRKQGIDFIASGQPDIILAMANDLEDPKPNTIGIERIDGCQIRNRKLLEHPNLAVLVKMYYYPDFHLNNLGCVDKRVFTRCLADISAWELPPAVSEVEFAKITKGLHFLHYRRHDRVEEFSKEVDFERPREIDVFFAGTTEYGDSNHKSGSLITKHRKSLVTKLQELAENNTYLNIIIGDRRAFGYDEYLEVLANSKVVISPWGWGEACYRDYEALICGCQLIKPYSYPIKSAYNIYLKPMVYWCNPKWIDLELIIKHALGNKVFPGWYKSQKVLLGRKAEAKADIIKKIIMKGMR